MFTATMSLKLEFLMLHNTTHVGNGVRTLTGGKDLKTMIRQPVTPVPAMTAEEAAAFRMTLINRGIIIPADKVEKSVSKGKVTKLENLQNKKNEIPVMRVVLAEPAEIERNVLATVNDERFVPVS